MTSDLTFQNTQFDVIEHKQQTWLTASQIGTALGYKSDDAISRIYRRNSDEFSTDMSETVNLTVSGNLVKSVRVFSLRGAHLIAMFSRTKVAKQFRKWVLDVLEKQTQVPAIPQQPTQLTTFSRLPNYYESGWLPALHQRCQSETHWTYHIKFSVRPVGDKFSVLFTYGVGGKGKTEPHWPTGGSYDVNSGDYFVYRDLEELWEQIRKVMNKYQAHCPF